MAIEVRVLSNGKKSYKAIIRVDRQKFSKTFNRKVEAESWERTILSKKDEGVLKQDDLKKPTTPPTEQVNLTSMPTVDELRELFLLQYCPGRQSLSTSTSESYLFRKYASPILGKVLIDQVGKKDIVQMFFKLQSEFKLSAERVNRIRQMLNCMYNFAISIDLISTNPVLAVKKLKQRVHGFEESVNFITKDEVARLLSWLKVNDPWLYPKVLVLINTGIRFGEMIALTPESLKGDSGTQCYLVVAKTYCRYSQKVLSRTKSGKPRLFPLAESTFYFLKERVKGKGLMSLYCGTT